MIVVNTERFPEVRGHMAIVGAPWTNRYVHQQQPTKTSCGPTTVAILASTPVRQVIARLPEARNANRRKLKAHRTNVGELTRLFRLFVPGANLDRRRNGWPDSNRTAVIRLAFKNGRSGWHWMLWDRGTVYDPLELEATDNPRARWNEERVSHYVIEERS